jgi:hypothetical protein
VVLADLLDAGVEYGVDAVPIKLRFSILRDCLAVGIENVVSGLDDMYFRLLSQELGELTALLAKSFRQTRLMSSQRT